MFKNFFENCAFYEIMWKNTVEHVRPQMTIWHMHIAFCIPKATNTLSDCVILIDFSLPQRFHERASQCYVVRTLPVMFPFLFSLSLTSYDCATNHKYPQT